MKYVSFKDDLYQGGNIISFTAINRLGSTNIRCRLKRSYDAYGYASSSNSRLNVNFFSEAITGKAHVMAKLLF